MIKSYTQQDAKIFINYKFETPMGDCALMF